ncbi:MAG: dihydrofolate reductase family protein [Micrococcaceae bacterium]|nr:dihydrofolate reductase family protein [Micrococcaceae bacterium]
MTRFRYFVAASVDGYIADEHDSLEWLTTYDDYHVGFRDPAAAFLEEIGAVVMGADTYRWLSTHMDDTGAPWPYENTPCWVFTHRELAAVPGADLTFIRGDVGEWAGDIAADAGDQDVWVLGGGGLAGQLVDSGHLDELILFTIPLLLGGGRPLASLRAPMGLSPTGSREFGRGVRETRYAGGKPPDGPHTGS